MHLFYALFLFSFFLLGCTGKSGKLELMTTSPVSTDSKEQD